MYTPQIDVCERPDEIVILVELPGVDRKDVQLSWKENILTISGSKRRQPDPGAKYMCVERIYGPFRREILIAIAIDHKRARAELHEGLMKIHLPKVSDEEATDTIPIE